MKDEVSAIYEELFALDLPARAWALIAKLNNLNMLHRDHIAADALRDAEERKAKDRERKRAVRGMSMETPIILLDNNSEGGVGETNSAIPRKPLDALAPVLGAELGRAVVEHRQKLRAPLTLRAAEQLAKRLQSFPDPKAAAEKMLEKGWKSIELDWMPGGKKPTAKIYSYPQFKPEPEPPDPRPDKSEREAQVARLLNKTVKGMKA